MKLHRTYPIWLHLLHILYHGIFTLFQIIGFITSFNSPAKFENQGPGWHFRYVTTWILVTLALYMLAAFIFDIILILKGINNSLVKQLKIHLDRFFCLMFSICVGLGFFFHLLFFISCKNNHHCPEYTEPLWFLHLMLFWYGLAEYFFVPHNTKRDIKTTPILVFIFCFTYFINYWLFVLQTHGHHPYGNPWPAWQWVIYFCFPLTMLVLRLLSIIRDRLFYKRGLRSHCIYPPKELSMNPWLGWHPNYSQTNECEIQPINMKAICAMTFILSSIMLIWNIVYLITSL
ncbi:unnamed protein product [Adineta steineri]|uniref:Uncharacterized protein n=1 Tax=Adineta steineri TaxID=433720 RepID=A0A813XJF6_9BILA|nr:unnamed protein product [Adineta steineri]CAF0917343.1 unnamed protein product [Adineta steineri]CAF3833858.1 unnamed protein product [Adineta steineri]CAF3858829.1 unnamed protein product [Adineta steineri]